jgi:hypothetical protein
LDYAVITVRADVFFGSALMPSGTYENTTRDLFAKCPNQDRVYDLIVFDSWICNVDRHSGHLLVRHQAARGQNPERWLLLLNDHLHCMVLPTETPSALTGRIAAPVSPYVQLNFVRDAITDPAELLAAIQRLEQLSMIGITAAVQCIPEQIWASHGQGIMLKFLDQRRGWLRQRFNEDIDHFPGLKGSAI